jgi:hypothetical protein
MYQHYQYVISRHGGEAPQNIFCITVAAPIGRHGGEAPPLLFAPRIA